MIGDIYRIDVRGRYLQQTIVNTFHYKIVRLPVGDLPPLGGGVVIPTEGTEEDANELVKMATLFKTQKGPAYDGLSVAACVYSTIRCSRVTQDRVRRQTVTLDFSPTIGPDEAGLPPGVSVVINRRYPWTGTRRFRGHLSVAAYPASAVEGGVVKTVGAPYDKLVFLRNVMRSDVGEGVLANVWTATPVIGQFRRLPPIGTPIESRPATDTFIRLPLGTQRSRVPGHGRSG